MRIKRFEAPDATSALAMVKAEMGDDAVILATRTIGPSKGNIVKKGAETRVEVVAAMDYDLDAVADTEQPAETPAAAAGDAAEAAGRHNGEPLVYRRPPPAARERSRPAPPRRPEIEPAADAETRDEAVRLEAQDLRMRFASLLGRHRPEAAVPAEPPPAPTPARRPVLPRPRPEDVAQWRDQLIDQLVVQPAEKPADGPLILAMVGATGVGKTTTAAKLAAWFSLRQHYSVALLSMDCYRIGATDQLRTYAKIMRLPCEVALRRRDLAQAIDRHRHRDVIIIDTAGKSPYDPSHIDELGRWFGVSEAIEPYLVLAATTKKDDLARVIATYEPLAVRGLILTKLDETRAYAVLCQQAAASRLPIAYLCTGQRVPEDFLVASRPFLDRLFRQGWPAVAEELGSLDSMWNEPSERTAQ